MSKNKKLDIRYPLIRDQRTKVLLLMGIVIMLFVLYQPLIIAQDKSQYQKLKQVWVSIQNHENKQVRKYWWQSLSVQQLSTYIQAGVDVNVCDKTGWTPLHSAARYNSQPDVLNALLQAGAQVEAKDSSGDTPLHWAAAVNTNTDIITELLRAGADVNARDKYGWIPLHTAAAMNSNPDIIGTLIKAGSKRNIRAYYIFFTPKFLLKHSSNMSEQEKARAQAMLTRN